MTDRPNNAHNDDTPNTADDAHADIHHEEASAPDAQGHPDMPEVPDLLARINSRIAAQQDKDDSTGYAALDGMRDSLNALKAQAGASDAPAAHQDFEPEADLEAAPDEPASHTANQDPYAEVMKFDIDEPAPDVNLSAQEPWTDDAAEQLTAHCEEAGLAADHDETDPSAGSEGARIPSDSAMNYVYLEPGLEHRGQHWLENRLEEISKRLDAVGERQLGNGPELRPLLDRFDALEARMDTALANSAGGISDLGGEATGGSLHDIELCIAEIATQLEATNSELTRIESVEAQITDIAKAIAAQRDATPIPTPDPAEMFDMAALASLVADKVSAKPMAVMGSSADAPVDAAGIGELSTVMKEFMRERRSEGEHANAVLDTMQQTIIRVLDRMEALEAGGPRSGNTAPHAPAINQPPQEARQITTDAPAAAPTPASEPRVEAPVQQAAMAIADTKPARPAAAKPAAADDTATSEASASIDRLERVMGQLGDKNSGGQPGSKPKARPQPDAGADQTDAARNSRTDFIKAARQAATKANQPIELQTDEPLEADRAKFANAARQAAARANQRTANDDVYEDEIDATDDGFSSDSINARLPHLGQTNGRARLLVAAVALVAVGLVATKFMMSISSDAARKELHSTDVQQKSQIGGKATTNPIATVASVRKTKATPLNAGRLAQNALAQSQPHMVTPGSVSYGSSPSTQALPAAVGPQDAATTANQPLSGGPGSVSRKALPSAMVGPLSLRLAAANGDPSAEFQVAARFADGKGVKQDFDEAIKWYSRAAGRGFALAQYRLGTFYERGLGVEKDLQRAQIWYQRAASNDNIKAMHNLAVLAAGSSTGKPDYATAAQWFTKAAERGLSDSQFNLAILHQNGLGVPQDDASAYKWFSLAANRGDKEAVRRMTDLAEKIGKAQTAKLDDELRRWLRKPSSKMANDPHYAGQAWQRKSS